MTPSEKLVIKTMEAEIEEGMDAGTALVRAANTLGISRERIAKIWIAHRINLGQV